MQVSGCGAFCDRMYLDSAVAILLEKKLHPAPWESNDLFLTLCFVWNPAPSALHLFPPFYMVYFFAFFV